MRLSVLIALTAATLAHAGCYSGGGEWGAEQPQAFSLAEHVCNEKFSKKEFVNGEPPLSACLNMNGGKRVEFAVKYVGTDYTRTPTAEECYDGLQKEIGGCGYGGSSQYDNFAYTYVYI